MKNGELAELCNDWSVCYNTAVASGELNKENYQLLCLVASQAKKQRDL
jgi:hypothetical protein